MTSLTILPTYKIDTYNEVIIKFYKRLSLPNQETWLSRLEKISAFFLGQPYLLGALGEGPAGRFDQSPLYRTDMFDCVTYVNTVLALAYAHDLDSFLKKIIAINYWNSQVAYQNRHHFMSVDWNVANAKLGFIQDVTGQIVDENNAPIAETAVAYIDRSNWIRFHQLSHLKLLQPVTSEEANLRLQELHALAKVVKGEWSHLSFLPLTKLFNQSGEPHIYLFDQIPSGGIIEIVRPNWDLREKIGTCLNVSHLGFVFRRGKDLIFREASLLLKQVCDVALIDYLRTYLNSTSVKGIHIEAVLPR